MRGQSTALAVGPEPLRPAGLCVLFSCHHLLFALPVSSVSRLLLAEEVSLKKKHTGQRGGPVGVVSVEEELLAAWNLGAMLGLGPVSVACVIVQLPHASGEVRLALQIGSCLRVQRFRCEQMVPGTIFQSRKAAFPGAFDASTLRRQSDEANVALWLEPTKLWTPRELSDSLAAVEAVSNGAGAP